MTYRRPEPGPIWKQEWCCAGCYGSHKTRGTTLCIWIFSWKWI